MLDRLLVRGCDVEISAHALVGIVPMASKALRRQPATPNMPQVHLGDRSVIMAAARIYTDVRIGADCLVGDGAVIREQTIIGNRCVIGGSTRVGYECRIGNDVRINDSCVVIGRTVIGDGTFIGPGVVMANQRNLTAEYEYDPEQIAGPRIGCNVRIGAGAILLPGITIGDGAVIAAGALVINDVLAGKTAMSRGAVAQC